MDVVHFLLVPDKAAGRRLRREIAARGARCGVVVGTWAELVAHAQRAYLVTSPATDWDARLGEAARKVPDAFWVESLMTDSEGTLGAIGCELHRILAALRPNCRLEPAVKESLSARGKRHLADLVRLHKEMGFALPDGLAVIRDLLAADKADVTRAVLVYRVNGLPPISPWQEALLEKLRADAGQVRDPALDELMTAALVPNPSGKPNSALRHLQENLFGTGPLSIPIDDSVACLAVRDHMEEVEVVAGMAQKALAADTSLVASDIGLLVPADPSYEGAVREVFLLAGIPVSGLAGPPHLRNLGGETVFHFLATRRRPAPAMALAALYASSLQPWDAETGNRLAMGVMGGNYKPRLPEGMPDEGKRMMALVQEPHETLESLQEALREFGSLLNPAGTHARHAEGARSALEALGNALEDVEGREVPWDNLARLVPQAPISSGADAEFTREGLSFYREKEEPWRSVRLLFVLGFSEGRYPAGPARSSVFDEGDLFSLKSGLGFVLETGEEGMARRRELFLRQMKVAKDRVVFLIPSRNARGDSVAPSGTTAFMSRLFEGIYSPEDLILTLERESHRSRVRGLAEAPPADPVLPRLLEIKDPDLGVDLLAKPSGEPRSETPSSLETLMVSPLSWFLQREGLLPLQWAPEILDPATKGTLAHAVFEHLFVPGGTIPTVARIRADIPKLLSDAILRIAPFLLGAEWYVERRNLQKEIETAAIRWCDFLERTGAKILGVETRLVGVFDGVAIRGRTDLLLVLPSGRLFVVDYKKSTSTKRRTCMEEGFDIQTSFYRQMLTSGKVIGGDVEALTRCLAVKAEVGVLYYMMDDQRALTDTSGWLPGNVPGVLELGEGISANGDAMVRERIRALRSGRLPLNLETDVETFDRVGVKTYALKVSPLVTRFVHLAKEEPE